MSIPLQRIIRDRVAGLNVWKRGGRRAPHKPLLLLIALGRALAGAGRLVLFSDIEEQLTDLLRRYGPPRDSFHPEYPFWRLQNDQLWEIPGGSGFTRRKSNTDPPKSELIRKGAKGGFPEDLYEELRANSQLVHELLRDLLTSHFPASYHEDLLDDLGIPWSVSEPRSTRDPGFRFAVVQAYEHRCAICGYDGKLGNSDLALEAAHIKWHQAGGPDDVSNGLALCVMHHKALDRGAIGLDDDLKLIVSADLHGTNLVDDWFLRFAGEKIRAPHSEGLLPSADFVTWHRQEVFREPPRC